MTEIWTVKKILEWSEEYFAKQQIDSPKLTAQILLSHVLRCKRIELFLNYEQPLTSTNLKNYKELVLRRVKHEPVDYITGQSEFMGHTFHVGQGVLIPRPETEILAEKAIEYLKSQSVLPLVVDIGTGSGALAVSLKKNVPELIVWATDISRPALDMAMQNAKENQTEINFFEGFFPEIPFLEDKSLSLLLVSNPPYIKTAEIKNLQPEVKDFEPQEALDGGPDGLEVIKLIFDLIKSLPNQLTLFMEIGYDQSSEVMDLAKKERLQEIILIPDYQQIPRIIKVVKPHTG
ncbi:MAG: peptide chain release factor N(5)-glutamine methyltransferase [Candidatus Margulisbacteria bacterium]|nr:peptide chain release factor N(5)-glutamine methyltransferase [Candidatus Margulisiibacteriota bacterium]